MPMTDEDYELEYLSAMEAELDMHGLRKGATCVCHQCCLEVGYLKKGKFSKVTGVLTLPTWSLVNNSRVLADLSRYEVSMVSLINVFGSVNFQGRYAKSKQTSWAVISE